MELKHTAIRDGRLSSFLKGELQMSTGLMNKLKWGDSIRVNGHPVTDNKLFMSLASFVEASEMCGDDCHGRLFVTMKRPKEGDA